MPIIPRRPFWDLERWFEEEWPEERWWLPLRVPKVPTLRAPRMDVYETDGKVVAEVELPGVDPKNIKVEVKENILKVEAEKKAKKEEKGKGYYRKEITAGFYKRAVPLPGEVISEKAEAVYEGGVLKITIPKKKPKKVEVKKPIKVKVKTA